EEFVKIQNKYAIVLNNKMQKGYTCWEDFAEDLALGKGDNPSKAWVDARKKIEKKMFPDFY
ncbi:MAG: hypothetical protein IH795_05595, partial [Bacteroidetes bacterium]|nr:hypothetical protein [Bacteroidota bacterium]